MKKTILFTAAVLLLCLGSLLTCFAAYNYASPPRNRNSWNFDADRSYTMNGECDIYYYKGSAGIAGIGAKNTMVRSCTKAIPYWYSTCIAAVRSSSGQFYASHSGYSESSNREMHSGWADARTYNTPQMVQYEYSFFQVSGDIGINTRSYFYDSNNGFS